MKATSKRILSFLIVVVMVSSSIIGYDFSAYASNDALEDIDYYNMFYSGISEGDYVECITSLIGKDGNKIEFTYDDTGKRASKISGSNVTSFLYEGDELLSEDGAYNLTYTYDFLGNLKELLYNDVLYTLVCNDEGSVVCIKNDNGVVAEYHYDESGICTIDIYDDGIGEIPVGYANKIRFCGLYFDEETGFYYGNGRFYDPASGSYIDSKNNSAYGIMPIATSDDYVACGSAAGAWANQLLSNPNYGVPIAKFSGWYNNLETVEIFARLIYGEASNYETELRAVTWVVLNKYWAYGVLTGQDMIRAHITAAGQFSTIYSGTSESLAPNTTSERWKRATFLACVACTSQREDVLDGVIPRPDGITNQCYFRALRNFAGVDKAPSVGVCRIYLGDKELTNVTVVGDTLTGSAHAKNAITIAAFSNVTDKNMHNIFFNYK